MNKWNFLCIVFASRNVVDQIKKTISRDAQREIDTLREKPQLKISQVKSKNSI